MLKVKVVNLPVFYDGKRYLKDDELTIKADHQNEELFKVLEEVKEDEVEEVKVETEKKTNSKKK